MLVYDLLSGKQRPNRLPLGFRRPVAFACALERRVLSAVDGTQPLAVARRTPHRPHRSRPIPSPRLGAHWLRCLCDHRQLCRCGACRRCDGRLLRRERAQPGKALLLIDGARRAPQSAHCAAADRNLRHTMHLAASRTGWPWLDASRPLGGSRWRDAQGHTGAVHDMTACGQEGSLGASLASISADKSCIVWEVRDKRLRGFGRCGLPLAGPFCLSAVRDMLCCPPANTTGGVLGVLLTCYVVRPPAWQVADCSQARIQGRLVVLPSRCVLLGNARQHCPILKCSITLTGYSSTRPLVALRSRRGLGN